MHATNRPFPWPHRILAWITSLLLLSHSAANAGGLSDIKHVVIFMQENRAFDHYFGSLRGVRGFDDANALVMTNGRSVLYQPSGKTYILPFHTASQCLQDVDHSWSGGHDAWNNGRWDRWINVKGTTSIVYHDRSDLAYYYALADAYTICDAYHCSVLGPTNPNRLYLWTGMIDPRGTGGGPVTDNTEPQPGFRWTTYPERLQDAGVSWKIYQETDNFDDNALAWFDKFQRAKPGTPLYDRGMVFIPNLVAAFAKDVTNNTLPQVSWIIARTADSEHPSDSPSAGAAVTQKLLDALASNPAVYQSTVFILNYDENGGFYDHLVPPTPAVGTPDEFAFGQPIGLGVRVPMIVVSPWTRGGFVASETFDHTSILRFLELWTGVKEPNISAWRRQVCGDLTSVFDFSSFDPSYPALPKVTPIICTGGLSPQLPAKQVVPVQEVGTRPARPLPYQLSSSSSTLCASNSITFNFTNAGSRSAHVAIYANAFRKDGPWQLDINSLQAGGKTLTLTTNANGNYDFSCYGPDGFHRRYAGNLQASCESTEVGSSVDLESGSLVLSMVNNGNNSTTFTVTPNAFVTNDPSSFVVAPLSNRVEAFPVVTNSEGHYDFTVTSSSDPAFLRRFAGRIEVGLPSLRATRDGELVRLSFPSWAALYKLESRSALDQGTWVPETAVPSPIGSRLEVQLLNSTETRFFRLRRP